MRSTLAKSLEYTHLLIDFPTPDLLDLSTLKNDIQTRYSQKVVAEPLVIKFEDATHPLVVLETLRFFFQECPEVVLVWDAKNWLILSTDLPKDTYVRPPYIHSLPKNPSDTKKFSPSSNPYIFSLDSIPFSTQDSYLEICNFLKNSIPPNTTIILTGLNHPALVALTVGLLFPMASDILYSPTTNL